MSEFTVFYSWQSDAPEDLNKKFILEAITAAVDGVEVQPAERLGVQEGMKGVSGSPEIATMLFEKISDSVIFIGDVSLVGQITKQGYLLKEGHVVKPGDVVKRVPNPNVSIEMGFAAGVLKWHRIICVLNEAFGKREDQPFDTRNRRFPIDYRLTAETTPEKRAKELNRLTEAIRGAVQTIVTFELERAKNARGRLDVHAIQMMLHYAKEPWWFPQPIKPSPKSPYSFLRDLGLFHRCTVRLLDLGILRTNLGVNYGRLEYAYHWTEFGKKVLELIPKPPAQPKQRRLGK